VQTAVQTALATTLGVPLGAVTITSPTPTTGRRLLQGLTVSFTVATLNVNTAALLSQQISNLPSSSFVGTLNNQLLTQGVVVSSITVSTPVTGAAPAPTKVQPWNAHKKISIGLGVGLGLGIGLPLVIITAYCCRKPADSSNKIPTAAGQPVVVAVPVVVMAPASV